MMNKYCKGCKTYDKLTDECGNLSTTVVNPNGECPCTNCLVKPICNYQCEDHKNHFIGERG